MASSTHIAHLRAGKDDWHPWRAAEPDLRPDLRGLRARGIRLGGWNLRGVYLDRADLMRSELGHVDLEGADLSESLLNESDLRKANLDRANLRGANLAGCDLRGASLLGADLRQVDLTNADLSGANLSGADLEGASLIGARLVQTRLCAANLSRCLVYGVSVWDTDLYKATQTDLVITPFSEHSPANPYEAERVPTHLSVDREADRTAFLASSLTVDNLEVAAFLYLLLNNSALRNVIDTLTSKLVLILGRFSASQKPLLDALRSELRSHHYLPIVFDFDGPLSRDASETISTLAHLARFVVADITSPASVPHELMRIIPQLPSLPIQTLCALDDPSYSMFTDLRRYPWVLNTLRYDPSSPDIASLTVNAIRGPETWLEAQKVTGTGSAR